MMGPVKSLSEPCMDPIPCPGSAPGRSGNSCRERFQITSLWCRARYRSSVVAKVPTTATSPVLELRASCTPSSDRRRRFARPDPGSTSDVGSAGTASSRTATRSRHAARHIWESSFPSSASSKPHGSLAPGEPVLRQRLAGPSRIGPGARGSSVGDVQGFRSQFYRA